MVAASHTRSSSTVAHAALLTGRPRPVACHARRARRAAVHGRCRVAACRSRPQLHLRATATTPHGGTVEAWVGAAQGSTAAPRARRAPPVAPAAAARRTECRLRHRPPPLPAAVATRRCCQRCVGASHVSTRSRRTPGWVGRAAGSPGLEDTSRTCSCRLGATRRRGPARGAGEEALRPRISMESIRAAAPASSPTRKRMKSQVPEPEPASLGRRITRQSARRPRAVHVLLCGPPHPRPWTDVAAGGRCARAGSQCSTAAQRKR
jgi:hypothetical protein